MENLQKAEGKNNNPEYIEIFDIFRTIQGEGPYSGHPAVFVRLAGCNLRCPGCDTDYTSKRRLLSIDDIWKEILPLLTPNELVVLTGGEPFRQNTQLLIRRLLAMGVDIQIETNGTVDPGYSIPHLVTVVCSPKTPKINAYMEKRADHYKYVINHKSVDESDGLPISALGLSKKKRVARPPKGFVGNIYLQPEDMRNEYQNMLNTEAALKSCLEYGYILQLQVHKLIGVD